MAHLLARIIGSRPSHLGRERKLKGRVHAATWQDDEKRPGAVTP
jgi:hypothetical protein